MEEETRMQTESQRDREPPMAMKAKTGPQRRASEVEPGCQRTDVELVGLRTKAEPNGAEVLAVIKIKDRPMKFDLSKY